MRRRSDRWIPAHVRHADRTQSFLPTAIGLDATAPATVAFLRMMLGTVGMRICGPTRSLVDRAPWPLARPRGGRDLVGHSRLPAVTWTAKLSTQPAAPPARTPGAAFNVGSCAFAILS
jgi:hypothetical protein